MVPHRFFLLLFLFACNQPAEVPESIMSNPISPFSPDFNVRFDSTFVGKLDTINAGCGINVITFEEDDIRYSYQRMGDGPICAKGLSLALDTIYFSLPYSRMNHDSISYNSITLPVNTALINRRLKKFGLRRVKTVNNDHFVYRNHQKTFDFYLYSDVTFAKQRVVRSIRFTNQTKFSYR